MFADDRLWIDSSSGVCTHFFAIEIAGVGNQKELSRDCGGRTPTYDTSNTWRSLLIAGGLTGVTDGLEENGALRVKAADGSVTIVQAADVERLRAEV